MNKLLAVISFSKILFCFLVSTSFSSHATVSIEHMFKDPLIGSMVLRPDGKAVLILKEENNIQYISIKSLPNESEEKLFTPTEYGAEKSLVSQIIWLDNRYFAINFFEPKKGIADLVDTKTSRRLLIIDSQATPGSLEQVLSVKTPGWLVKSLPSKEGEFLYAKSGIQSRIYKLKIDLLKPDRAAFTKADKIDGGQFIAENQITQVDGYATRWFSRKNNQFVSALHFSEPYVLSLTEFGADGKYEKIFSWRLLEEDKKKKPENTEEKTIENYLPFALGPTEGEYYCLDRKEEESKSLYLVNFKNKSHKLIFETAAFKIIDLVFSPEQELVGVQVLKDERILIEPVVKNGDAINPVIQEKLALTVDSSKDSNVKLIYEESYNQPGQFWLETKIPKTRIMIGERYPWLSNQLKSKQVEGSVNVEGVTIPYLLNLPITNTKVPLIVMPHGGPIGIFDSPYFDNITQFFNAQGYAVLRVNFRGSSGRNKELREAGRKEWGRLMLKDIFQATTTVLQRTDVNKARVCLFGISYGGYAATMLLINHPDVYRCGVAIAGVYDVNLHLQNPQLSEAQDKWLKEYVGDYQTEYDALKLISPVFLADKLQKPLLLLHGDEDDVVDIEQTARMKFSLDKANNSVEFIKLEKMGHSINSAEEAKKLFSPSMEFLRVNL